MVVAGCPLNHLFSIVQQLCIPKTDDVIITTTPPSTTTTSAGNLSYGRRCYSSRECVDFLICNYKGYCTCPRNCDFDQYEKYHCKCPKEHTTFYTVTIVLLVISLLIFFLLGFLYYRNKRSNTEEILARLNNRAPLNDLPAYPGDNNTGTITMVPIGSSSSNHHLSSSSAPPIDTEDDLPSYSEATQGYSQQHPSIDNHYSGKV